MYKFPEDRAVTTLAMPIGLHFHTLFGFSQTTYANAMKGISLDMRPIINDYNGDIRTLKRTLIEESSIQLV